MTFEQQVEEVLEWFKKAPEGEQKYFKNTPEDDLIKFHHTLGRSIRNNLKLWEVKWKEEIIHGIDVSPNHPDAISMKIINEVWSRVKDS